jgi:hypothetical protein
MMVTLGRRVTVLSKMILAMNTHEYNVTYATLSNPRKDPGVRVPILLPIKERNLGTGGK